MLRHARALSQSACNVNHIYTLHTRTYHMYTARMQIACIKWFWLQAQHYIWYLCLCTINAAVRPYICLDGCLWEQRSLCSPFSRVVDMHRGACARLLFMCTHAFFTRPSFRREKSGYSDVRLRCDFIAWWPLLGIDNYACAGLCFLFWVRRYGWKFPYFGNTW